MATLQPRQRTRLATAVLLAVLAILALGAGLLMMTGGRSVMGVSAAGETAYPYPYPMHSRIVPVVFAMPAPTAPAP